VCNALASFCNAAERNTERVLREGIARTPKEGRLHYSLGLLLAEELHLSEAAAELEKAAELLPDDSRVHYNVSLAPSV
jgi:hypothetical protein